MKKIILYFIISITTIAHPHVFYNANYKLYLEKNYIKNLEISLNIDEMNTLILTENIKNIDDIKKSELDFYVDLLRDIHIEYDKKKYPINFIKSFVNDENMLVIDMDIEINCEIKTNKKLIFSIYDTEFFYNYEYSKEDLKIYDNDFKYSYKFDLNENKKKAFYFDSVYPMEFEVKFE